MRRALVFGTFDSIHPGHKSFLRQAKRKGRWLIASIARDSFVREAKGREPVHTEHERITLILETGLVNEAYLADERIGTYSTVLRAHPDIICFGHDQEELQKDLEKWLESRQLEIQTCTLRSYKPERYKSSKLLPVNPKNQS